MSHPNDPHWPGSIDSDNYDPEGEPFPLPTLTRLQDAGLVPDAPEWTRDVANHQAELVRKAAAYDRIKAIMEAGS